MDRGLFRAIEYFAILYDIQIDEEVYNEGPFRINIPRRWGFKESEEKENNIFERSNGGGTYYLNEEIFKESNVLETKLEVDGIPTINWAPPAGFKEEIKRINDSRDSLAELGRRLLLARFIRGQLQRERSRKTLDLLDDLAKWLLKYIPNKPSVRPFQDEIFDEEKNTFLLRLMYLLEISSCSKDRLQIGYADESLDLIEECFKEEEIPQSHWWKTPYELVALYNRAQGYLHIREFERAEEGFKKILEEDRNRKEGYYGSDWYQWRDEDRELFREYVYNQSYLMMSDTLIKAQRSKEARSILLDIELREYKKERSKVLEARIENDLREFKDGNNLEEAVNKANTGKFENRRNLLSQYKSSLIERYRIEGERELDNISGLMIKSKDEPINLDSGEISDKLTKLMQYIEKYRNHLIEFIKEYESDEAEIEQAVYDWTQAVIAVSKLPQIYIIYKEISDYINKGASDKLKKIIERLLSSARCLIIGLRIDDKYLYEKAKSIATDPEYHVYKEKIRAALLKGLEDYSFNLGRLKGQAGTRMDVNKIIKEYIGELLEIKNELKLSNYFVKKIEELDELLNGSPLPRTKKKGNWKSRYKPFKEFIAKEYFAAGMTRKEKKRIFCPNGQACWSRKYNCNNCSALFSKRVKDNPEIRTEIMVRQSSNGYEVKHFYDEIITQNQKRIDDQLYRKHNEWKTPSGWGFVNLQRWNSFTPAMAASEGGGYFLYHSDRDGKIDLGIVIDPGYGYVKNYLGVGFGIDDINGIIVSHNHPDHLADFTSIINLLIEARKNRTKLYSENNISITAGLSKGAYMNLLQVIDDAKDVFKDTRVFELKENGRNTELEVTSESNKDVKVHIKPVKTYHEDSSHCDSIGFLIRLEDKNDNARSNGCDYQVGMPCDTKWDEDLFENYRDCKLIILHLGSMIPSHGMVKGFSMFDYFDEIKTSRKVLYEKQQLYLPGVFWACYELFKRIKNGRCTVILSEFGEELCGGLRADIALRLEEYFDKREVGVVAGDVGLIIDPLKHMIKCSCCDVFFNFKNRIKCQAFGPSEQMFYVCPNCDKILSMDQKHQIFTGKMIPKQIIINK